MIHRIACSKRIATRFLALALALLLLLALTA